MLKKLKKCKKKYNKFYIARMNYLKYYKKLPIDEKSILLEAQHGDGVNGNIYYIIKELTNNPVYNDYKIYLSVRGRKIRFVNNFLKIHNITNVNTILLASKNFFKVLASAKYLITDTAFTPSYLKKEGQIVLNTWHGTPWKTLGKKVENEPHKIANIQKNFFQSDYLLYPSEYMKHHMIEDYMLENICKAETLMLGYPRNTAFFDEESKEKIKEELEIQDKQVIVYMPTWRGGVSSVDTIKQNTCISYFLLELDKKLEENQIMYVQLHPFVTKGINFKMFKNIKQVPKKYETYEFLNIADCLITDYSSVFIDFAIKRKKIILFTYDIEEYLSERGLYLDINKLPFPKVDNIEDLWKQINLPIDYDDTEFLNEFCKYESADVTKKLCEKVILGIDNGVKTEKIKNNGKENILIYAGNLAKNGITSSITNLLKVIDTNKYNYYITFIASNVGKYKDILFKLPEGVNYIATAGKMNATLKDKIIIKLFTKNKIKADKFIKLQKDILRAEIKREYCDIKFSTVIQFSGYEQKKILLFSLFDANKIIYVHSDMNLEIKTRANQRYDVLKYAYTHYDKVAIVTEDMKEPTSLFTNNTNNFYIANNVIDYKTILDKSQQEIILDNDTELNIDFDELKNILNDSTSKKYITIGRFSPEKGHIRLIEAFNKVWIENNNTYLVIIGGHGKSYDKILNRIEELECKNNVIVIKSISNPYAILKKCDYFVLSSFYEGFGLVIAEAAILGKPVISTDIQGPRSFINKYNGTLVENSEYGLYDGMKKLLKDEIKPMNIDFEKYNEQAVKQFYTLLKK